MTQRWRKRATDRFKVHLAPLYYSHALRFLRERRLEQTLTSVCMAERPMSSPSRPARNPSRSVQRTQPILLGHEREVRAARGRLCFPPEAEHSPRVVRLLRTLCLRRITDVGLTLQSGLPPAKTPRRLLAMLLCVQRESKPQSRMRTASGPRRLSHLQTAQIGGLANVVSRAHRVAVMGTRHAPRGCAVVASASAALLPRAPCKM